MKGLKKKFRQSLAGILAFCLTMTSFNMVSWADVEKAFENENAIFDKWRGFEGFCTSCD
uniref:hypothetical protein n=1 Tax=Clostridium sp. NkU-1 TaxID=1095009 RepID=UPI00326154B8